MKRKGKSNRSNRSDPQRTLVFASEGVSVYGHVIRPFGQCRFEVDCSDMMKRVAKVAGRMHKREFIKENDYVLVCLRPGEDKKGDIICKYYPSEIKVLKANKELPDTFGDNVGENLNFEFEE